MNNMTNPKLTRRNFIKNASAATGAMMIPPILSSKNIACDLVGNISPANLMKMKKSCGHRHVGLLLVAATP